MESDALREIRDAIRTIPDYPKPGVMFRDITTLLGNARVFRSVVDLLVEPWLGRRIDRVAGIEARGFILGGAIAHQLSAGFVPIRKKGKLPHTTVRVAYSLDRKSTRLNSSHEWISYAVFCLKKKISLSRSRKARRWCASARRFLE